MPNPCFDLRGVNTLSNEEKILSMLTKMQDDITEMKENLRMQSQSERKMTQREVFNGLANLLDDDEKEALGRYQAAEEARKAAMYG